MTTTRQFHGGTNLLAVALFSEVFFSRAHAIVAIFRADFDTMPFPVIYRMVGIITNAVLIPEFSGDLVQGILDLVSAVFTRTSGNQPSLASAGIGKRIEHVHV